MIAVGRLWLLGPALAGLFLAGCTTSSQPTRSIYPVDDATLAMYAPVEGEPFPVPAVPVAKIDPQYRRQVVETPASINEKPGTIVVDPQAKFLYLVQADGRSIRYGIGVGRQGFSWSGEATVNDKQEWPKWFPPAEMQVRDSFASRYPNFAAKYPDGMDGGPKNPLGARALYLYQGNKDTLYRIHATNEPFSIGNAVSSGCIRMFNQDVIDLYNRVPLGTKVVVLAAPDSIPFDPYQPGAPVVDMPAAPTGLAAASTTVGRI